MTQILLVEDDLRIAKLVKRFLVAEGFTVGHIEDGKAAVEAILAQTPDLVILDMMLPQLDGIEVCTKVRPQYDNPILMLTAHDDDLNHVLALNSGVDDYLTKPIKPEILLARIHALLRRAKSQPQHKYQIQDLAIDRNSRTVHRGNQLLPLSDADFELLWVLVEQAGQIINRDQIFNKVLDIDFNGLDRAIDMRISKLRKKLGDNQAPYRYIKTIRNRGYMFLQQSVE